ncbi:MAG: hypothetical protein LBE91_00675 [Tannerella sp.]|nr:hypothetical protein [Tannerella sp.]
MKILYSKHFPPRRFSAINLFGLIIVRKEHGILNITEQNHERIHTRQMLEMLVVFFYLFYVTEWFIRLLQYGNRYAAYRNISFEREAYRNMHNLNYLKNRKIYAFVKYMKQK